MIDYDPFSEAIIDDPYPVYRRLRDEAPAYYLEKYDAWALSRFEDIWNACMNAKAISVARGTTGAQLLTKVQPVSPMIASMDPPDHTRLRTAFRPFFAPAGMRKLEPAGTQIVRDALDAMLERGGGDLVEDLGMRIATKMASLITGFPREDGEMLYGLVQRFMGREEDVIGMTEDGLAAMGEMAGYFTGVAARRRAQGTEGAHPLDVLIEIEIGGRKLGDEEIASHMIMLLIGGTDTFPKVFANLALRLFENPDQRREIVRDPSLGPGAFVEGVRIDMPTQFLGRTIVRDMEFHGESLRAGQALIFLYPSANRDEREFENPDTFDIHRKLLRVLSFGHGTHACLGIHSAKLEGRLALEALLASAPEYTLDLDAAERHRTEFVQGFAKLPVRF